MEELYLILIHTMKKRLKLLLLLLAATLPLKRARCDSERTGRKSASGGYVHRGRKGCLFRLL